MHASSPCLAKIIEGFALELMIAYRARGSAARELCGSLNMTGGILVRIEIDGVMNRVRTTIARPAGWAFHSRELARWQDEQAAWSCEIAALTQTESHDSASAGRRPPGGGASV